MSLQNIVILNVYSVMIVLIIYFQALRFFEKGSLQDRLYMMILSITALLLIIDVMSRFDGYAAAFYPVLNAFGNFVVFLLNPVLPSLWVTYVHLQIFHDERGTHRLVYPLGIVNTVNAVLLILTQFFGWYYYIDSDNIYHRGTLFLIPVAITSLLVLTAFTITVIHRGKLDKRSFLSLIFVAVPPSLSIILQIIFYGIPLMLNSVVLSLLIVFLNLQNHSMYTDHLTGVSNRKKLDMYLKEKVNSSTEEKGFSAILIDINDFKYINDTYGHDTGDQALETAAKLLKSCLRSKDFIARFGGDEFLIVLDTADKSDLEAMVRRIARCLEKHNEPGACPYKLGFSMGYAVFDRHSYKNAMEFLKQVDLLMYEDKLTYKKMKDLN